MKTVIYTNIPSKNPKREFIDLIIGLIFIVLAFTGLFMGSTLILTLVMYIFPILLGIYAIRTYKMAYSIRKNDKKYSMILLIQAIIFTVAAIYVIISPIKSLNYMIMILGFLLIIKSINRMISIHQGYVSFLPFLLGILCILFYSQIIHTFYTLFLIIILFIGVSKIIRYFFFK